VDDRAPLGEAGAQLVVLLQARAQAVQALGHDLAREAGKRMRALVDLDARDHAVVRHVAGEGDSVLRLLADGLVEQDRAADVLVQARGRQQQLAVGAAVLLGVLDADAGEALGDGAGGFVDGGDALAGRNHGQGGFGRRLDAHVWEARGAAERPVIIARGRTPLAACQGPASGSNGHPSRGCKRLRAPPPRAAATVRYSTPSPSARPPAPTSSSRSVLVAPRCSMWSPLVNMMWSPATSRPASCNAWTASRAASRVARPRLSKSIGNTSRISAIRRREPAWRDSAQ